jgi:hypothetical protein
MPLVQPMHLRMDREDNDVRCGRSLNSLHIPIFTIGSTDRLNVMPDGTPLDLFGILLIIRSHPSS